MEKCKIGIIGLGGVAQLIHLPILKKMNDVEVKAVCEINKTKLTTVAEKFGVPYTFSNHVEMLEKVDLDAVIIATPTHLHKEIALDCISHSMPILIEKPLAPELKDAEAISQAASEKNVQAMVGMNMRFRPDAMLLKSIVGSGEIGNILYVKSSWLRTQSSEGKWFTKKHESGGGVIFDLGIVMLDLALWILDFPEVISVTTKNFETLNVGVEDSSLSFIRCKNDFVVALETSWLLASAKDSFSLEILGTNGNASLTPLKIFKKIESSVIDMSPSKSDNSASLFKRSYENEIKSFIGAVRGLNPLLSPASEALPRMKVIEAMYESAGKSSEIIF